MFISIGISVDMFTSIDISIDMFISIDRWFSHQDRSLLLASSGWRPGRLKASFNPQYSPC